MVKEGHQLANRCDRGVFFSTGTLLANSKKPNMRNYILSAFTCLLLALPHMAHAQAVKKQHEYACNIGTGSLYQILQNLLSSEFYFSSGIYGLSARYYAGRTVTVGGNISFEQIQIHSWPHTELLLTVAPEITISYWDRKVKGKQAGIRLYGLAAAGITANNDLEYNSMKFNPTFHLSPIGVRAGNRLGFFAELGLGYRGLLNCGLCYRPALQKNKVADK